MSAYSDQIKNQLLQELNDTTGLIVKSVGDKQAVCYMNGMIDTLQLNTNLLSRLPLHIKDETLETLMDRIAVGDCQIAATIPETIDKLLSGYVLVTLSGYDGGILVNLVSMPYRSPSPAENETVIYGPLLAFTESMEKNIALLRSYITNPNLVQETVQAGDQTHSIVSILYLKKDSGNPFVDLIKHRIKLKKIEGVIGSALFAQMLQDKKYSIFPEISLTERPDITAQAILENKVVVMLEGNSQVIIGPNSFFDFFQSVEDRYTLWGIGLFNRTLRIIGIIMSVYLTPLYVAALTYHYEVIPSTLLVPLLESRSRVPFQPLIESLLLEVSIELLREAGARLPTKVGQTMGIVGGIVIGQAAVQAGFTSNILIMLVALAALGSFTTPNYMMSSAIRFIRFPMLFLASWYGLLGIALISGFMFIHLLRMTSYGKPYLYPLYPSKIKDLQEMMLITEHSKFEYETQITHVSAQVPKWKSKLKQLWQGDIDE